MLNQHFKSNTARGTGPAAVVFDIQRFCLHDGPGIRTTVFLKGCPLRCAWCQNPESHNPRPEMAFYGERCSRCFQCKSACPHGAILDTDGRLDYKRCNGCGECALHCRQQALVRLGSVWDINDLELELRRDLDFFKDSGGGVTFSGGEPMLHADFLDSLLPRLRAGGIHINLETSGAFSWPDIERLLGNINLIYYDLKLMDPVLHQRHTRADNSIILSNFRKLAACFQPLQARMPLIPGINDTQADLLAVARFLQENGHNSIHCLPYHSLGEAKLGRIHSDLRPLHRQNPAGTDFQQVSAIFAKEGIHAVIYD